MRKQSKTNKLKRKQNRRGGGAFLLERVWTNKDFFRGGGFVGIILFTGKFSRCIVVRRGIILGKYFFWGCFPRTFSTKFTRSLLITLNVCIFVKSYCSRKSKSCCHNSTLFSLSLLFTLSYYDQLLNSHALLRHH